MSIRAWSKSLILLSLFALGACAQPPLPQERVLQYWEAVKLADWQSAAEAEASKNGHELGSWRVSQYGDQYIAYSYCGLCYDGVVIDTEKELVGGRALEQECDPNRIPF